jgi:predicted transposase/invertase (TIGR01784 family)
MIKLEHNLTNDVLFKMVFTKHQELLKRLVASLLNLDYRKLKQFTVTNPEIPPEEIGKKFCRLDINMSVDGEFVNLELQVENEGNYSERSLYHLARALSSNLKAGQDYKDIPRTIMINILGFSLFTDSNKIHSEFRMLDVKTYEPLTDKAVMHFFELPKLTEELIADNEWQIWLKLINAKTEEDLAEIEALEEPIMKKAISVYRRVSTSAEYAEIERLRDKADHDEAQALGNAERRGASAEREKWQGVVADLNASNAELNANNAELIAKIAALEERLKNSS